MAHDLTELVKINDTRLADLGIINLLEGAPLIARLHAVEASNGTDHKYLTQTTEAGAGFRGLNDGLVEGASADTLVEVSCKLLDASFTLDVGYCKAYVKGEQAAIDREGVRKMRSAMKALEKQVIYGTGTGGNSAGFGGLSNHADYDKKDDVSGLVVDAGGTTVGGATSVWLIRTAEDDLAMIGGNGGNIVWEPSVVTRVEGATGPYAAYYTPIMGWIGLQMGSAWRAVRICNLTEESGKGLTDALVAKAISKLPADKRNNLVLAMNRQSERQLQASRTATTPTGAPAPFPTESHGVPIVVTDQIINTEALLAAT